MFQDDSQIIGQLISILKHKWFSGSYDNRNPSKSITQLLPMVVRPKRCEFCKENAARYNIQIFNIMNTFNFLELRTTFLKWLVNNTATAYLNTFKAYKPKWKYGKDDLRSFPTGSLGKELANFLDENDIDLIPKAESHDVFHIVTGYKITAEEEIAMQYWLVGNGKLTPYTIGTCMIGMIVMPEFWKAYRRAFKKGMKSPSIAEWDFQSMLYSNANQIKCYIHQTQPIFINHFF